MKYLIPVFVLFLLITPSIVRAQFGDPCYELRIEGLPNALALCEVLSDVALILYWLAGALAVIIIIIGGIMYMTAGGDEGRVGTAKKTIIYGLIGAVIVLCAGFIINLIQEVIVNRLVG